jgi:hypothetical protein
MGLDEGPGLPVAWRSANGDGPSLRDPIGAEEARSASGGPSEVGPPPDRGDGDSSANVAIATIAAAATPPAHRRTGVMVVRP